MALLLTRTACRSYATAAGGRHFEAKNKETHSTYKGMHSKLQSIDALKRVEDSLENIQEHHLEAPKAVKKCGTFKSMHRSQNPLRSALFTRSRPHFSRIQPLYFTGTYCTAAAAGPSKTLIPTDPGSKLAFGLLMGISMPICFFVNLGAFNILFDSMFALTFFIHSQQTVPPIIKDYVPKEMQQTTNIAFAVLLVLGFAGLLRLAVQGEGIGHAVRQLWSKEEDDGKLEKSFH